MSGNMRERVGRRTIVVMLFRNCNILIILVIAVQFNLSWADLFHALGSTERIPIGEARSSMQVCTMGHSLRHVVRLASTFSEKV